MSGGGWGLSWVELLWHAGCVSAELTTLLACCACAGDGVGGLDGEPSEVRSLHSTVHGGGGGGGAISVGQVRAAAAAVLLRCMDFCLLLPGPTAD